MSTETEADLAGALDRIHSRLDALERKLDARSAVAARASEAEVEAALLRLLDRLDKVEAMVEALGTFGQRLPTLADAVGSTAAWAWQKAEERGIDPIQTGQRTAELALTAADPEMIALLERLVANRVALAVAVDALEAIDEDDLRTVTTQGAALTGSLAALLRTPELAKLLDASADPKALGTAQAATTALVETRSHPIEPVGAFGAFLKLGDPDVKRAVGFSLALAKRFGQLLS